MKNKKILVNWTLLNEGVQHNTDFKFNDKDLLLNNKYIYASHLISLKDHDHIIIFYTLSELAYLIDLNDDNYTKSNLVFILLILEFISFLLSRTSSKLKQRLLFLIAFLNTLEKGSLNIISSLSFIKE